MLSQSDQHLGRRLIKESEDSLDPFARDFSSEKYTGKNWPRALIFWPFLTKFWSKIDQNLALSLNHVSWYVHQLTWYKPKLFTYLKFAGIS